MDDELTVIAIASLACIQQDLLHEGLGHGVAAWLSGAHEITLSTVALQSDISTRWISASGTLVNLAAGAALWAVLQAKPFSPAARYFLVLAMAGNLFTATGYFLFSGIANFGDWGAVIDGLEPHWTWRLALVVLGVVSYGGAMKVVAHALRPFKTREPARLRRLCVTPYVADGVLAAAAGAMNPLGLFYVIASALPSTLGANAGLLALPGLTRDWAVSDRETAGIHRSAAWIAAALLSVLLFVFVLGPGITLRF